MKKGIILALSLLLIVAANAFAEHDASYEAMKKYKAEQREAKKNAGRRACGAGHQQSNKMLGLPAQRVHGVPRLDTKGDDQMRVQFLSMLARLLRTTIYVDGVRHGAKSKEVTRDSMSADAAAASR